MAQEQYTATLLQTEGEEIGILKRKEWTLLAWKEAIVRERFRQTGQCDKIAATYKWVPLMTGVKQIALREIVQRYIRD